MNASQLLARSPVTLSAYSEDKARVAAPFLQLVRVGDVEAHLWRRTKERTACQRCNLFASLLQSGVGLTCSHSRLI